MYQLPSALALMASYRQFILVQLVQATDEKTGAVVPGKSVKHPVNPQSLMRHNAHDPSIWMDWTTAATLAANTPVHEGTLGWCVGFVITKVDPFGCVDIDNCLTLAGTWNEDALKLIAALPGVVEVSQSGRGLHIWFYYSGICPPHAMKVRDTNRELYTELRFMALGNPAVTGTLVDVAGMLPNFITEYFPPRDEPELEDGWTTGPVPEYTPLTDEELLHRALSRSRPQTAAELFGAPGARVLPSFADLWHRNTDVLDKAFPPKTGTCSFDRSDADFALAKELAYWTGKDCERVARLMQQSALKRDKWLPSVHRKYFTETVMYGVNACTAVYHVKPILAPPPPPPTKLIDGAYFLAPEVIPNNSTFVGRNELAGFFSGCIYLQDQNAMLLPNGDIVDQARFNALKAGYTFALDNNNDRNTRSAWEAFLSSEIIKFPRVEGTCFDPRLDFQQVIERAGRRWVNVYREAAVERTPGDVGRFMDLLKRLLPNGDDALILLSYMASVVQNKGVKFRWAPFIQGVGGNGKSTIITCLKKALGEKYIFNVKAGMIENNFNAWLENNILYVADDIYSTKDRTDMMEALKSMITEKDHGVTYKGIDSIQKRICGNFIFTDNHKDAMKKQDDTRRICTLYCAQQTVSDRRRDGLTKAYFTGPDGLIWWLEKGGYAAVSDLLHTMPIDPRYDPAGECQEAPDTSATSQAINDGLTAAQHDIKEQIELGKPGFAGGFVSYNALRDMLKDSRYPVNPLKVEEMMRGLRYEKHKHLPNGRLTVNVQPENTRPVLYVASDTWQSELSDPLVIAQIYQQYQQGALEEQRKSMFNQGG